MCSVNIIVAVGRHTGKQSGFPIGRKGQLPWKCKEDMKWFKETTMNNVVIMGRNTYDSIGTPLKGRHNIVITSKPLFYDGEEKLDLISDIEDAIKYAKWLNKGEIFIVGGASIYKYVLDNNLVDNVYIDFIDEFVDDADAFFPFFYEEEKWSRITEVELSEDAHYIIYHRHNGTENHVDSQYIKLINEIIQSGEIKDTRAGKTRSLFAKQMRFDLKKGLPMLTTKKMFTKGVIHELLWFIKGDTNIKYLVENGVHIWDDDAYRYYRDVITKNFKNITSLLKNGEPYTKEEFLDKVKEGLCFITDDTISDYYQFGDLNKVYGYQWTKWGGHNQLEEVIETLKTNPDDRRMIVSAWNVSDIPNMALPPCHYCYQFYSKKMTIDERKSYFTEKLLNDDNANEFFNTHLSELNNFFDKQNVPTRKLSCMWNQRSVDCGLGLGFNIMSYALLTYMVAQCVNMDVDELIFNGGDVHIYENHIETLKTQCSRNPHTFKLPKLELNKDVKNISDFTYNDIKIIGYESYPTLKMPLSVGL